LMLSPPGMPPRGVLSRFRWRDIARMIGNSIFSKIASWRNAL
jgi:hypothetical protein